MGMFGSLGKTITNIAGGSAQILTGGLYDPKNGSIGTGNAVRSLGGVGGYATMLGMDGGNLIGSGGLLGSIGGGGSKSGSGGAATTGADGAYQAQVQAALASADAAKYSADKQFQLGQAQLDGALQQSRMAGVGGIISGAMAAQQDQTVRKQLLPHESGAATIMSHDLAQRWNKTLEMRTAGYQDAAINYEMGGRNWKAKWDDAQWNAMSMMKDTKKDALQNVQLFGIKSDTNPHGMDIPEDEWMAMHAMKDPEEIMNVDPAEASERNEQYAQWKESMYKQGKDLVVQMYENPQLAGNNIMTMKGKDALIDERIAPLVRAMNTDNTKKLQGQMESELSAIDAKAPQLRNTSANAGGNGFYFDAAGNMIKDSVQGGRNLTAKDSYDFQMTAINKEKSAIRKRYAGQISQSSSDKGIWDQAINAATKGEKNKYTGQIKELQKAGVIDQYGMINAAGLNAFIPKDLMAPPKFSTSRELSPEQKIALKDDYNKYAAMKVDEKLVRQESLGGGVTRKILLNKDGTRAASVMEGQMMDKMGNSHMVSIAGDRTQDFYNKASQFSGFSPMSPGYRAPITADQMSGKTVKSSTWNYMAKAATGQKGNSAAQAASPTAPAPSLELKKPTGGVANPAAPAGGAPLAAGG